MEGDGLVSSLPQALYVPNPPAEPAMGAAGRALLARAHPVGRRLGADPSGSRGDPPGTGIRHRQSAARTTPFGGGSLLPLRVVRRRRVRLLVDHAPPFDRGRRPRLTTVRHFAGRKD